MFVDLNTWNKFCSNVIKKMVMKSPVRPLGGVALRRN